MATLQNKKFDQWLLFATKNLQFDPWGPAFDSGWVHLGGFNVRADQKDQKVDFEYPPQNLPMPILACADQPRMTVFGKVR